MRFDGGPDYFETLKPPPRRKLIHCRGDFFWGPPLPCRSQGRFPDLAGEPLGAPAGGRKLQEVTLIRLAALGTFPLAWGRLAGGSGTRPRERYTPPLRNGMGGASRRPRPTGVMVHGGRAATRGRPYGQIGTFQGGRVRTPALAKYGDLSGLSVGAGHWPARRRPLAAHLIRPLRGHLPLKGKAFGRLIAAPAVHRKPVGAHSMRPPEFAPVPLVRKQQARERNRTSPNFPPTQAPSGAGRDRTQPVGPDGTALRHS